MPTPRRNIPHHLRPAIRACKQHNAKIREVINRLTRERVTDLLTIYGKLNEIADETHACDKDLDQIETGTREAIAAWNRAE